MGWDSIASGIEAGTSFAREEAASLVEGLFEMGEAAGKDGWLWKR